MVANLARTWGTRILEPIARLLGSWGLSPNAVSLFGCLLTVVVAGILATGHPQLAGILLIFTLTFDALDGALARLTGQITRFGAFLDSTLDRWAEVALYGALVWSFLGSDNNTGVLLAAGAMAGSLMVSYTRARAEGIGLQCKEGILTRFERLVLLIAGLIFNQVIWALWVVTVLATATAIQRIWVTWKAARNAI